MPNLLRMAGYLMLANAFAHLISFLFAGLNSDTIFFIFVAVVYGAIAYGLLREIHWLACTTFVIALYGMNVALIAMGVTAHPIWLLKIIFLLDLLVAAALFVYIWKGRRISATQM